LPVGTAVRPPNQKTLPIQLRSFEIIALEDIGENLLKYVI
jgi:hypothetical protein